MRSKFHRREALKTLALGGLGFALPSFGSTNSGHSAFAKATTASNLQHSVCRWCFSKTPLEQLCEIAQDVGITSIELTTPEEWSILKTHGLSCAVGTASWISLTDGFNQPGLHKSLEIRYRTLIDQAADQGIQTVICFSGNRKGISDEQGLEFCASGLDPVLQYAEQRGITVVMELLNSTVDHPDYQCDRTAWGAALVEKIGRPNFKLLYDIYHMQIMEGNLIATIQNYAQYIGHFHTAGVPGRHEIDATQELNYPAIMRAISATGYTGFVAQEFIPQQPDPIESLRKAVELCSV